jgi:TIR domain-containing protein
MADVLISYAKRHARLTEDLARDLEAEGFSTWWDTSLLPGDEFPEEIARQIDAAKVVIVIWADASVESPWVRAEANRAHAQGKLITLHAAGFDSERVPLPFNTLQSSPVTDRAKVFAALARRGVRPSGVPPPPTPAPKSDEGWSKKRDKVVTIGVLGGLLTFPNLALFFVAMYFLEPFLKTFLEPFLDLGGPVNRWPPLFQLAFFFLLFWPGAIFFGAVLYVRWVENIRPWLGKIGVG